MTMQKQESTLYFKQCLVCSLNMTGLKWKGGKQGQYWTTAFTLKAKCGICVHAHVCVCVCAYGHTYIHIYITVKLAQMGTQTSQCCLRPQYHQYPHLMPFNGTSSHPWAVWGPILSREKQCQDPSSAPWRLAPAPALVLRDRAPSDRAGRTRRRQRQAGSVFTLPLRSWGNVSPLDAPNTHWEPITGQTQLWACFFSN